MPTLDTTAGSATGNSFATLAQFTTYCDARLNASVTFAAASDDDILRALIDATMELSLLSWDGYRTATTQALSWPRSLALNPDVTFGVAWFTTSEIPTRVVNATCEYALAFLKAGTTDIAAYDDTQKIVEETVGPVSTQYSQPFLRPRGVQRYPRAWSLIVPLLSPSDTASTRVIRG